MMDIVIEQHDFTNVKLYCAEQHIEMEISEYFVFEVENAQFMKQSKHWDQKIRLYNRLTKQIYFGLKHELIKFAKDRNYTIQDNTIQPKIVSDDTLNQFIQSTKCKFTPHDYQIDAIKHAIKQDRALLLSPTASGKSLIIFYLLNYYLTHQSKKVLIIVPTITLVHQMSSDFDEYAQQDLSSGIHKIYQGQNKNTDKPIIISTWQSIYELDETFFKDVDVVIGDESHLFKSKSLKEIFNKLRNTQYRFGTTGTLDDLPVNKFTLIGMFGPVKVTRTTKQLIDDGILSDLKIKCLILRHQQEFCKSMYYKSYQEEIDFIMSYVKRNEFIVNLALSMKQNTLVLFRYKEKSGKLIFDILEKQNTDPNRKMFYIDGEVKGQYRDDVRHMVEKEDEKISLHFNDKIITITGGENIPLNNKTIKLARDITIDDDISDEWISRKLKSYKYY